MSDFKIGNDTLSVGFKKKGAELCSLVDLRNHREYIWQAEPAVWARHAPILFPIVGKLRMNQYKLGEATYNLPQHGFARDTDFVCLENTATKAIFRLESSEATLVNYPFHFYLDVEYELVGATLNITYKVTNKGEAEQYFSIGAHPGFNIMQGVGETLEDYRLEFEQDEITPLYQLQEGLVAGVKERKFLNRERVIEFKEGIFDDDALILTNLKSDWVALRNTAGDYNLQIGIKGFPFLGIWSKPGHPFICVEPWYGIADHTTTAGQLSEKTGIIKLEAGQTFACHYDIQVG
jgi:galactose mutarotase-like enzyme